MADLLEPLDHLQVLLELLDGESKGRMHGREQAHEQLRDDRAVQNQVVNGHISLTSVRLGPTRVVGLGRGLRREKQGEGRVVPLRAVRLGRGGRFMAYVEKKSVLQKGRRLP